MAGYHLRQIARGVFGEPSKIREELEEFEESLEQGNPIMALVELSDMMGAMEGYLKSHHPSITLLDLFHMNTATQRAFESGRREAAETPACSHQNVGPAAIRIPLAYGSAKTEICLDCSAWRYDLHGWSEWRRAEELPKSCLEDQER